jgi:hypothetical protein
MDPDIFCQLTRTDGSTVEIWLPARQVEVITDVDNPHRMAIFEALDIVSIETDEAVKDSAERLSDTDFRASHAPRSAAG